MKNIKILIALIFIYSSCNQPKIDSDVPRFDSNASIDEIDKSIQYIVSRYQFSVIFYERDNSNHGWYKMFVRQGTHWEKIEIREGILDEQQSREDPGYYISRDIITRKLCHSEESKFFVNKLKELGVFELPEEKAFFKNCRDTEITDLGYIYIVIVSGDKIRELKYSGSYECSNGEWENLRKIGELFEKEWFENTLCQ